MTEEVFHYPAGESFTLSDGQVHVWRASLDRAESRPAGFEQTLTIDEQERAARFRRDQDRQRFIVARGLLRAILSRYLKLEPQQLRFRYGAHGKPALEESMMKGVRFNVSHCDDLALFAVAYDREVGIDVEAVRTDVDIESIAKRYFTAQERAIICATPAEQKPAAFFTCWSLKEAYLKATGWGFFRSPDEVEISCATKQPTMIFGQKVGEESILLPVATPGSAEPVEPSARLLLAGNLSKLRACSTGGEEETIPWWAQSLTPHPGYVGALVTEGKHKEVYCWQWPGA
jgi:4'-phosphopantetheinyl transferase